MAPPRKLLVLDLGGLGDEVHLLPALWALRNQWPQAELHVLVNAHVTGLFKLTPWVNRVWGYAKTRTRRFGDWRRWARRLRAERYDLALDLKATDRSSLLTFFSGARLRIGRRPADGGPPGWRFLFHRVVQTPYYTEPMYWQKWRCVKQLGCAGERPEFRFVIEPRLRRELGIGADDEHGYLHLSPCTTAPARELPIAQLAELIEALRADFPGLRLALSCAPSERERERLAELVGRLQSPPWKIFAGTLGIDQLAALIQTCALNLCGDTGSLHLAMMTGAPALAWFRHHRGEKEWIPEGAQYRVLIAPDAAPRDALYGLATAQLRAAAREILNRVPSAAAAAPAGAAPPSA